MIIGVKSEEIAEVCFLESDDPLGCFNEKHFALGDYRFQKDGDRLHFLVYASDGIQITQNFEFGEPESESPGFSKPQFQKSVDHFVVDRGNLFDMHYVTCQRYDRSKQAPVGPEKRVLSPRHWKPVVSVLNGQALYEVESENGHILRRTQYANGVVSYWGQVSPQQIQKEEAELFGKFMESFATLQTSDLLRKFCAEREAKRAINSRYLFHNGVFIDRRYVSSS